MQKSLKLLVATVLSVAVLSAFAFAQDDEKAKPKHTIKEVMKGAMKGGLNKKVLSGKASDKEKLELLDMYISLVENEAPKGDAASWQKFSGMAALAAAKAVSYTHLTLPTTPYV